MAIIRVGKVKLVIVALCLPFAYAGCSIPVVQMQTKFDYSEHKPYLEAGENSIKGQAFLRQQGGGVVTCAGSDVILVPATPFFREAIGHVGNLEKPQTPERLDPAFMTIIKRTQCDEEGNFSFEKVPNGTWFVFTEVSRIVGESKQGVPLMREIPLSTKTTQILLTQNDRIRRSLEAYVSAVYSFFVGFE